MFQKLKQINWKYYHAGSIFFVFCILSYSLLSPSFNERIGSIFFGRIPWVYNLSLAQYFFTKAAFPLVGQPAPFAYHQLSRTYFIKGELEPSLRLARKEIEIYPEHKATYYIIGLTLGYMNREKEAIDAFGSYIVYNPTSWAARNDKAWLEFRIGDIDGALRTIEPVSNNTSNPWVQNTYGTMLMNKKRYEEAEVAFLNAERVASGMTEKSWGAAYPGNDPRIYGTGLSAMRLSIAQNIALVRAKTSARNPN